MNTHTAIFNPILVCLVLAIMLISSSTGCMPAAEADAVQADSNPFYTDSVISVRFVMSQSDWEYTQKNIRVEEYVKADMWFDGELIKDIAIRPKGNSSLNTVANTSSIRCSFKADLNFFNSARNMNGVKKLNFNNGFSDPTFIREVLAYEIFEQMGLPTPRTAFVDLWVNDTHMGLYTMVEQIDATFIENNFANSNGNLYKPEMPAAYLNWTETDLVETATASVAVADDNTEINLGGANLSEIMRALEPKSMDTGQTVRATAGNMPPQGMAPPLGMQMPPQMAARDRFPRNPGLSDNATAEQGFVPPAGMPSPQGSAAPGMPGGFGSARGNLLEQMGLKTNENKPNHNLLLSLLEILNNEPDETFPAKIEEVLDVDNVLRFLAVSAVIVHLDNYIGMGHNYYLYDNGGKFVIIPWDMNMAFGTFNVDLQRDALINFYIDEPTPGTVAERPLVSRLLSYGPYLEKYRQYIRETIEGPFTVDKMNSRIDELVNMIRPYVEADELRFYSLEQFEKGLSEDTTQSERSGGFSAIGLKGFIKERIQSVIQQLAGTRKSSSGEGSGNGGTNGMGNRMPGFRR